MVFGGLCPAYSERRGLHGPEENVPASFLLRVFAPLRETPPSPSAVAAAYCLLLTAQCLPRASAASTASATISAVTSNGSLWIVSRGAVARRATWARTSAAGS